VELMAAAALILYGLFHDVAASRLVAPPQMRSAAGTSTDSSRTSALDAAGTTLAAGATVGFALSGLGIGGILVPAGFVLGFAGASVAMSLLLFVLFFRPWVVVPIVLDLAIAAGAFVGHW
jgi:hypothetical protein